MQIITIKSWKTCVPTNYSIEERVKQMEARIMTLVEESCMLSARTDPDDETAPKKEVDLGQVCLAKVNLNIMVFFFFFRCL